MKKLLMTVMAYYALTAHAQVHESKNFLYLYSDSVIHASKIALRPDFSGFWQLRADSHRVPSEQVKFFSNDEGFFANTRKLSFAGISSFSERIIEGKINIFQERIYDPFAYNRGYRYRNRRQTAVDLRMYYNRGLGDLKKVNYNNLKNDIGDDAESMNLLNSYRKSINTSKILYATAGASLVAGLVSFLVKGNNSLKSSFDGGFGGPGSRPSLKEPNFTSSFILFGLGTGLAIGGFSFHMSGSRHLESAIDTYNR